MVVDVYSRIMTSFNIREKLFRYINTFTMKLYHFKNSASKRMSAFLSRKRNFAGMAGGTPSQNRSVRRKVAFKGRRIVRAIPRSMAGVVRTSQAYSRSRRGELKFFDTAISFNLDAVGEVPASGQLNLIAQGTGQSQRIGRIATVRSMQLRLNLDYLPTTAATASGNAFIYVVLDTQCNGAAAAITDVLTGSGMSTALINLDNSQRFRILKKIKVEFQPGAGVSAAYNEVRKCVDVYMKLNVPLEFSSTTGAITELRSNNIFLLAGGDGSNGGVFDDLCAVTGNCRLRYTDS